MPRTLKATAARLILLGLDWLVGRFGRSYRPRHAAPKTGWSFVEYHRKALLKAANSGHVLAWEYLVDIGFPEAERYASAFGRAVAGAYRVNHSAEPNQGCLAFVNGRIRRVFGYSDVSDLYAGAYSYQRTREFLNSQRASALHAFAA